MATTGGGRTGWLQDAKYASRALRKDPGFLVFATLIIGWAWARARPCTAS